jgi:hypothetical protein
MNTYKQNEKTKRFRGRFWDLKTGISARRVICTDQKGSIAPLVHNIILKA